MNCPVCVQAMVQENFGIEVYVCESSCKGIFFDHSELQMLDKAGEGMGPAIEAALLSPRHNDANRAQLKCPRCSIPMHAHRFNRDEEVNVDECYGCGGFFLDAGELKEIRDHYMSDADVQAYTDKLVAATPGYAEGMEQMEKEQKHILAIKNFTKILTTNYWKKKFQ